MASDKSPKSRDLRSLLRNALGGDEVDRERAKLLRILEINQAMVSERQPKRLLSMILDAVIELCGAERGFLILRGVKSSDGPSAGGGGGGGERGRVEVARNLDREAVRSPEFKISHGIAERVMRTGEIVLTDSATDDPAFGQFASVAGMQLRSILCAPLVLRGETVGCVYIDHRFKTGSFTQTDARLLELFSNQASVSVENARLHAENDEQRARLKELNEKLEARVIEQETELQGSRALLKTALPPPKYDYSDIIGRSQPMREVFRLMDIVAETDYPVLILGESGTGKELVAQAIVRHGRRRDRPFLSENCAAVVESLLEAELFGHTKGAFTGATSDRKGLFEQADGGTLFLDEIGDMPTTLQSKLLRVLQEGEFRKVGSATTRSVDVRIIAATNVDLAARAADGAFREDLFYRLKVMTIRLPPLRERRADIPILVDHVLERVAVETGEPKREVARDAMAGLVAHDWPGNVRELENELRRMAVLAVNGMIGPALVEGLSRRTAGVHGALSFAGMTAGMTLDDIEKAAILAAIERCGGRRTEAAKALGLPRRTFYNRLQKYGIQ